MSPSRKKPRPKPSRTAEATTKAPPSSPIYPYADFAAAADELARTLTGGSVLARLVGESGTGKTSLLRHVAGGLDRHRTQVVYISQKTLSPVALGRLMAMALHVAVRRTHAETLKHVGQVVRNLPQRLVLLLDESHHLPTDTLEEVRLLAESELDAPPLFSVVFAGPPELRERFDAPELFPLKRRIGVRLELTGLRAEECLPFLEHRLGEVAGRFGDAALELLFERSRGVPALVEDNAKLVLRHAIGPGAISREKVDEVLETWEAI